MSKRPIDLLLNDIIESIDRIEQYTKGMSFDAFSNDQKSIDAVVRNLEIIGEAANRLPDDFKENIRAWNGTKSSDCEIESSMDTSALTFRLSGKSCMRICLRCVKPYPGYKGRHQAINTRELRSEIVPTRYL